MEFLDELVYGAWSAAWPLIRSDLGLSYVQVGLLLSLPAVFGSILELPLGLLGDTGRRRVLVRMGGVAYASGLVLLATSNAFAPLLLALMLLSPAGGAFVGLSQASLMDLDARRHEHNMARWALAGSLGLVAGPMALSAAAAAGFGWRATFFACAVLAAGVAALVWRAPVAASQRADAPIRGALAVSARNALGALRRREVVRWLVVLQFADLMLDVLHGFLALYFVDVAGLSGGGAALAILVWTGVGLAGDALVIPLLERVEGTRYLRASACIVLVVFPAFLLVPGVLPKLILLGALGLLNSGWYSILAGRLYAAMPGQSATVMTLSSAAGLLGGLLPLAIGAVAQAHGLAPAMWLLLAGPLALLAGIPRPARRQGPPRQDARGANGRRNRATRPQDASGANSSRRG